jgi:1-deoxy-D-xylulose-5-phosphate reductoisomerase
MPTVYNAANEKAVALFLDRKISYLQIVDTIEKCMEAHTVIPNPSVEEILQTEAEVYAYIDSLNL